MTKIQKENAIFVLLVLIEICTGYWVAGGDISWVKWPFSVKEEKVINLTIENMISNLLSQGNFSEKTLLVGKLDFRQINTDSTDNPFSLMLFEITQITLTKKNIKVLFPGAQDSGIPALTGNWQIDKGFIRIYLKILKERKDGAEILAATNAEISQDSIDPNMFIGI